MSSIHRLQDLYSITCKQVALVEYGFGNKVKAREHCLENFGTKNMNRNNFLINNFTFGVLISTRNINHVLLFT